MGGAGGRRRTHAAAWNKTSLQILPGWQHNKLNSESFVMLWCVCVAVVLKRRVLFFYLLNVHQKKKEVTSFFCVRKSHDCRGETVPWLPAHRDAQSSWNMGVRPYPGIHWSVIWSWFLPTFVTHLPSPTGSRSLSTSPLSPPPSPVRAQFKHLFASSPPPSLA